jgi:TonB family protein
MKRSLVTLACLLTLNVMAQKTIQGTKAFEYFDKDWHPMSDEKKATYLRVINDYTENKTLWEFRDFRMDGHLIRISQSASKELLYPHGLTTWYNDDSKPIKIGYYENAMPAGKWMTLYNNGQKKVAYTYLDPKDAPAEGKGLPYTIDDSWDSTGVAEVKDRTGIFIQRDDSTNVIIAKGPVKNGRQDGQWEGFLPDGQKSYEEEYKNGVLVKGTHYDAGTTYTYTKIKANPAYVGGEEALAHFLSRHIKYPVTAQAENRSGLVVVQFQVQTDGQLTDIWVQNSVDADFQVQALKVVKAMPKWTPAEDRGKKIAASFSLPIRFSLSN